MLFEVGYCREGFGRAKMQEKRQQHALLRHLLRKSAKTQGKEPPYTYHTITLGVAGTIYADARMAMDAANIRGPRANKLVNKWIDIALNYTHGMVVQRRHLDAHYISAAFTHKDRPPN